MSRRIDIINQALSWLGANSITSVEDDSDEARVMKLNYDNARDSTLEAAEWTFAIKRWIPAKDVDPPVWGASFRYLIPSDIIRVILVETNRSGPMSAMRSDMHTIDRRPQADWQVESGYIISNDDGILCKGIRRVEDEGIYTPLFTEALAGRLAMLCAYPLTESDNKYNAMAVLSASFLKGAWSRDAQTGSSKRIRNRSLRNAR